MPTAHSIVPDPRVGAVFADGDALHFCSGAVLDSAPGDLILTAAHCLAGDPEGLTFVPGFGDRISGQQGWRVEDVYLDPRWAQNLDPVADFAILRVSRADGVSVQSAAGGGLRVGSEPAPGTPVTVVGYSAGVGGEPAACRVQTSAGRQGFPAVHCDGLVAGFSGAPWIAGSTVSGLVGGLHGGGCADEVSFTPPFDSSVPALVRRAEAGGPGDDAPTVYDDGCRG